MNNRSRLTQALAIIGTVLVWLPILAPLFFGLASLMTEGIFRLDYLMPAELFLLALVGGGLLIWAARRNRSLLRLTGWSLGTAIVSLIGCQLLATATGLASGETAIGGWQWFLVSGLLAVYTLAVVVIGVGGALLLRDLFQPSRPPSMS